MAGDVKVKPVGAVDSSAEVSPVSLARSMVDAITTPATPHAAADGAPAERAHADRSPPAAPVAEPPAAVVTISAEGAQLAGVQAFDPADADHDGVVTPREQAEHDAKVAAERAAQGAMDERTPEAEAAMKEYVAVELLGQPIAPDRGNGAA